MNDAIVIQGVSKKFRRYNSDRPASLKELILKGFNRRRNGQEFWALNDVSFSVPKGKMVGVIGQNGAGKSTLLRLIGGVGKPDSGTVSVNGRIGALLDLTTGFHPDLTGRENVFVSGVICGLTREEVAAKMDAIIDFAELKDFIDNPIRTYSTGMQMRLGFAIAIHTEPEVLLIDEVLAVGDLAFQQKCLQRINSFKEKGCTILLISHDLSQVKDFCDEVIWLRGGRLLARGEPGIVVGEYTAVLASETRRRTPTNKSPVVIGDTELRANVNRFGSMEVEIACVKLLDSSGEPTDAIQSGEALSVVIDFESENAALEPIFTLSISREDGFICYDTSTESQNIRFSSFEGRGQLRLHLDRLDLVGGKYFIDVGCFEKNWAYGYDYHWHVYPLSIKAPFSKGILSTSSRWEIHDENRNHEPSHVDALANGLAARMWRAPNTSMGNSPPPKRI